MSVVAVLHWDPADMNEQRRGWTAGMTDEQLAAETVATTTADLHTAPIAAAAITFKHHQLVIQSTIITYQYYSTTAGTY